VGKEQGGYQTVSNKSVTNPNAKTGNRQSPQSPRQTKQRKRIVVAQAQELPPGERKIVAVNGREIGVFNVKGEYYALLNYCPHRAGPLCHGRVGPLVTSEDVYQVAFEREGEILKCPWHMWEFDIRTGRALFDPKMIVRTYEVRQEGSEVILYV
jgi:nitrite reductase/ring-hydroxylating ferredoxin subunit